MTHQEYEEYFRAWCERKAAESLERRRRRAKMMLRVRVTDRLPMARVWMHGPKWKRAFNLTHRALAAVDPEAARDRGPLQAKTFWWYDWEDDVRELVLEEIRPGVVAAWSDPRERLFG